MFCVKVSKEMLPNTLDGSVHLGLFYITFLLLFLMEPKLTYYY
jgi:hypothetical protein